MLNEFKLKNKISILRELVTIKKIEELKNRSYKYLVKAVLRV